MTRFRHTGVVITAEPTSKIGALVNQVLKPLQREAEDGSVVLLFGGYNTMGQEFGGDQFEVGRLACFEAVRELCYLNIPRCCKDQYPGSAEYNRFEKLQSGRFCAYFYVHVYLPACLSACLSAGLLVSAQIVLMSAMPYVC